ncbi:MAG TPA: hypothetical protein VK027_10005 [Chitinophagaceae bacterium]|nr:hypothetical protein [Chitinophagaceae bacterium]
MTLDRKNNVIAWSITIGIHILLLLLFFLIKYATPQIIAVEELGMEVNLGTSEDGYGFEQPEWMGEPANSDIDISKPNATSEDISQVHTNPDGDVAIQQNPREQINRQDNTNRSERNNQSTQKQERAEKPKYDYANMNGTGGNTGTQDVAGGSEGNTHGSGDRGVPYGTVGAENYEGEPGPGGVGVSTRNLSRTFRQRPSPAAKFNRGGQVKITIEVNSDGDILPGYSIEAPNAELKRLAEEKLKEVKFNKIPPGPPQHGIIFFDFKTSR